MTSTSAPVHWGLNWRSPERARAAAWSGVMPGMAARAVSIRAGSNRGDERPDTASTFSHSTFPFARRDLQVVVAVDPSKVRGRCPAEIDALLGIVNGTDRERPRQRLRRHRRRQHEAAEKQGCSEPKNRTHRGRISGLRAKASGLRGLGRSQQRRTAAAMSGQA